MNTPSPNLSPHFLQKGGKMGELIRGYDWAASPLGEIETWPLSLRISLGNMLRTGFPMMVLWGHDLISFYNDAFRPSMGAEEDQHTSLGKKAKEVWAEMWKSMEPRIELVWETGEPVTLQDVQFYYQRNGGLEETYWTFSYSLILDDKGDSGGIMVTCMETTQTVMERNRLKENESKLRSIIAHAPAAIAVFVGEDLIIEHPNELFIELFDKGDQIEGKSMHSLLSGWVEGDQQFLSLMQGVFESGKAFEANEVPVFFKKENRTRYFNISFTPLLDNHDKVYAVLDVSLNVTDQVVARKNLEASETHLELLSNTVPAMIFYLDAEQHYRSYNETFMRWFNTDKKEALGKTVREFIGEKAYAVVEPHLKIAYAGQQEIYEMRAPSKYGEDKWLSIVYTPHKNEEGEVLGLIVHATDVTQSKKAEIDLQEKNQELLRVNNDLDNFIYTASHDLKAPISNLEGLLSAFQDSSELDESQQQLMDMMSTSIERFKTTLLDLTEISKAQRLEDDSEIVSFRALVDEICLDIRELIEGHSPQIETHFLVKEIHFSRKNLRSILYNLLSNALKYSSPNRPPIVSISTEESEGFVLLTVTDNGLGLSEENQNRIFGMFQRVHHHIEGTGIGLYMIKKMIENVGGHITLTSKEGEGSSFKMYLPHYETESQV